jgi:hypothetical protein
MIAMGSTSCALRRHRQLDLDDDGVLRWLVIDRPDGKPWIAFYRTQGGVVVTVLDEQPVALALMDAAAAVDARRRSSVRVVGRRPLSDRRPAR